MSNKTPPVAIVALSGRVDAVEAGPLRDTLNEHLAAGTNRIVVELSSVTFVDSAGLAALVIAMKRARMDRGDVRLVKPQHPDAQRVFELTKFDSVFEMFDTVESAQAGW